MDTFLDLPMLVCYPPIPLHIPPHHWQTYDQVQTMTKLGQFFSCCFCLWGKVRLLCLEGYPAMGKRGGDGKGGGKLMRRSVEKGYCKNEYWQVICTYRIIHKKGSTNASYTHPPVPHTNIAWLVGDENCFVLPPNWWDCPLQATSQKHLQRVVNYGKWSQCNVDVLRQALTHIPLQRWESDIRKGGRNDNVWEDREVWC